MFDDEIKWDDDEVACWLAFDQMTGIGLGRARAMKMFEYFGGLKNAWKAKAGEIATSNMIKDDVAKAFVEARDKIDPESLLSICKRRRSILIPLRILYIRKCCEVSTTLRSSSMSREICIRISSIIR
ncbi:hypothetical protein KF707_08400 [Candidatus Obscuribacterales bacterium]|nr:hypothetical protein [Candidatus Obscuribacterales bacterium]